MATEISLHNVVKVSIDAIKNNSEWVTLMARVHQKDGSVTEITLYSVSEKKIAIQIGEEL